MLLIYYGSVFERIKGKIDGIGFALKLLLINLLFVISGSAAIFSQEISISAKFDTTSIMIGEQTDFTITVEHPSELYIEFPEFKDTLIENIEILSASRSDTLITDENRLIINKSWRVTSFEEGQYYVEDIPLMVFNDNNENVLYTRQAGLEVLVPEIDDESGIYDIKAPFEIPVSFLEILPWILLALAAAASVWFLFRYFKNKRSGDSIFVTTPPAEPAHLVAMRELKQLRSDSLWQKGLIKEYYTRLTEILRRYIEKRFAILAMERTSSEIINELKQNGVPANEVTGLLNECFSLADLVKFAKAQPEEGEHDKCLNTAFRFVKATFKPDQLNEQSRQEDSSTANEEKEKI